MPSPKPGTRQVWDNVEVKRRWLLILLPAISSVIVRADLVELPHHLNPDHAPSLTDRAHAMDAIEAAPIENVHMFGRRGPIEAGFTTKELTEMVDFDQCASIVDAGQLPDFQLNGVDDPGVGSPGLILGDPENSRNDRHLMHRYSPRNWIARPLPMIASPASACA